MDDDGEGHTPPYIDSEDDEDGDDSSDDGRSRAGIMRWVQGVEEETENGEDLDETEVDHNVRTLTKLETLCC